MLFSDAQPAPRGISRVRKGPRFRAEGVNGIEAVGNDMGVGMTLFYSFLWLLVVHFVADFMLQSDWMAQNKSKNWSALSIHILVYTMVLQVACIPLLWASFPFDKLRYYALINGVLHFATDAITSRINKRLWEAKEVHWFFVGVGADQLIHQFTLALTLMWLVQ